MKTDVESPHVTRIAPARPAVEVQEVKEETVSASPVMVSDCECPKSTSSAAALALRVLEIDVNAV